MSAKRQTETADQMAVVRWARAHADRCEALRWMYHAANEGKVDPRDAGRRQSMGVVAGIPDLFLPARSGAWSGLYIEMKRRPNKPTPEQTAFMEWAQVQGYKTCVCYSREDAIAAIADYLGIEDATA